MSFKQPDRMALLQGRTGSGSKDGALGQPEIFGRPAGDLLPDLAQHFQRGEVTLYDALDICTPELR